MPVSQHPLLGSSFRLDTESGHFVSQEHARVAQVIHDYDPNLKLVWIPPAKRKAENPNHFALAQRLPDGREVIVRTFPEADVNTDLVIWVAKNDPRRNHNILADIEAAEQMRELMAAKREEEIRAEKMDMVRHIIRNPKSTYTAKIRGRIKKFEG